MKLTLNFMFSEKKEKGEYAIPIMEPTINSKCNENIEIASGKLHIKKHDTITLDEIDFLQKRFEFPNEIIAFLRSSNKEKVW